jgi:hypothetical protein
MDPNSNSDNTDSKTDNIELGDIITKPSITSKLKPGGWYLLQSSSPFILTAMSESLHYIESKLKQTLPDDPKIILNVAGSQVVSSSVNIFLEFSLVTTDNKNMYVRCIVNDKAISVKDQFRHEIVVNKLYYTSKKLF